MRSLGLMFTLACFSGVLACGPAPAMIDEWPMFDPDWIVEVEIDIDEEYWEQLRVQTRSFEDVMCNDKPPPNPFTYFPADLVIDGIRVENVGVRKKCFFGSCSDVRPALKVSFNEYVRGRRFFGMRRLTLNNNLSDPSNVKQCLGYWLFRRAGAVASRCNFAHVTVNGVDKGIYSHIESIKTELLSRHFDDTSGNLYEGALSDFQPDWVGTYQKKTNQENPDRSDLDAVVEACQAPDDEFLDALEPLIALEEYYTFWAMEVAIAHWDGYAARNHNNTYIYNDPQTGKFHFIPWGIDGIMFDRPDNMGPRSVFADAIIPHRLYQMPETRAIYLDRLTTVLDTVWIEDEILAEIDRMEAMITPYGDPYGTGQMAQRIEDVRSFVRNYPGAIRDEIESGPVVWDRELPGPPCMRHLGEYSASFSTAWESISGPDPWGQGTGTLEVAFYDDDGLLGDPWPTNWVVSASGMDPNPQPGSVANPMVWVAANIPGEPYDTQVLSAVIINDRKLIVPDGIVPLNIGAAMGVMIHIDPVTQEQNFFLLLNGELRFDQASMTPGEPVSGTIQAQIRESGW